MSDSVYPKKDDFAKYLDTHDKEFLELRMSGVGFERAVKIMKEKFTKEATDGKKVTV